MPLYQYVCECGRQDEVVQKVSELDVMNIQCTCGSLMRRVISTTAKPQVMDYYSENADAHFTGPRQKARVLREKGLTEIGDMKLSGLNHHGKI